ncbi:MAG: RnfABCDGE type electron transport complex subunit D, partial [Pseudomonadota bacterium]
MRRLLTILGSPAARTREGGSAFGVTRGAPHVRDAMSVDRAMNRVIVALVPCIVVALLNTGHQANLSMAQLGLKSAPGWRGAILQTFGIGYDPSSLWANMWHGGLYYLPVLAVAAVVGAFWERLFAAARGRERAPGLAVVALLFSLSLPPTILLWQVALGITFGIVVAKEIFGGTGKNFLNPALAGLAFLYATYPKQMVGEAAWTVVEGFTGATPLRVVEGGAVEAATWAGSNWMLSFLGGVPGAFGETSTLACILGAAYLIVRRIASGRIIAGA